MLCMHGYKILHTVEFFHVFLLWVEVESLHALFLVRNPVRVFRQSTFFRSPLLYFPTSTFPLFEPFFSIDRSIRAHCIFSLVFVTVLLWFIKYYSFRKLDNHIPQTHNLSWFKPVTLSYFSNQDDVLLESGMGPMM